MPAGRILLLGVVVAVVAAPPVARAHVTPELGRVAQLNPRTDGSFPGRMARIGNDVLFSASSALWRSDGTASGTTLVQGNSPGFYGFYPNNLVAYGGAVFFAAYDTVHGNELWKSDGTTAGTVLVKDIKPGTGYGLDSGGGQLTVIGDRLYFVADDGDSGRELWRTDGTTAGTERVADVRPGTASSDPWDVAAAGGQIYFSADDGTSGRELWRVGGPQGAQLVKDVVPGPDSSYPQRVERVGTRTLFTAVDPTPASSSNADVDLWETDGTATGTTTVYDFPPSSPGPGRLVAMGSEVFLTGVDDDGAELWASNGTTPGTRKVKDVWPGSGGSAPSELLAFDGVLLFAARLSDSGSPRLVRSDGTTGGTAPVYPGIAGPSPQGMRVVGDEIWFSGTDAAGREPWATDGTVSGTRRIKDVNPGGNGLTGYGEIGEGVAVGGGQVHLFAADDGTHGSELWRTDGTGAGTSMVRDLNSYGLGSDPQSLTDVAGSLFFTADDGTGRALWKTTGTEAGTTKLLPGTGTDFYTDYERAPRRLTAVGATLFFTAARDADGRELWRSDGTPAGTARVKDLYPGPIGSDPEHLTAVGDLLLFVAGDDTNGRELWRSDGTPGGTQRVKDFAPGPDSGGTSRMVVLGGRAYFAAWDESGGNELWTSDGTEAGTTRVTEIIPGPYGGGPDLLTVSGGRLFFVASTAQYGSELWTSDGTEAGTVRVSDLVQGPGSAGIGELMAHAGGVLFTAYTGSSYEPQQFWTSDGTAAGTKSTNSSSARACFLAAVGADVLYVNGNGIRSVLGVASGLNFESVLAEPCTRRGKSYAGALFFGVGGELWETNGTPEDTFLVRAIRSSSAPDGPHTFAVSGGALYFASPDSQSGDELWRLTQADVPAPQKPTTAGPPAAAPIVPRSPRARPLTAPQLPRYQPVSVRAKLKALRGDRRRARYRVTGTIALPTWVSAGQGCGGRVTVRVKRGKTVLVKRSASVDAACAFKVDVRVRRSSGARRRPLLVLDVRFEGNDRLLARSAASVRFRARR